MSIIEETTNQTESQHTVSNQTFKSFVRSENQSTRAKTSKKRAEKQQSQPMGQEIKLRQYWWI